MKKIIYYVATTVDGFICDEAGGIDGFSHDETLVGHYQQNLLSYKTTIMGRGTYEFGYAFGLKPGQRAYPHMEHYIYSKSIELPEASDVHVVRDGWEAHLKKIKETSETDIYLCGGSQFAGFVLDNALVDELIVKLNPFCLGRGKPLFGSNKKLGLELQNTKVFDCGVIENAYRVIN